MYEPEAADLLMKLGLSVAKEATPSEGEGKVVPLESVQALSAAMSLIGGDSGVSADVRCWFCCFGWFLVERVFVGVCRWCRFGRFFSLRECGRMCAHGVAVDVSVEGFLGMFGCRWCRCRCIFVGGCQRTCVLRSGAVDDF